MNACSAKAFGVVCDCQVETLQTLVIGSQKSKSSDKLKLVILHYAQKVERHAERASVGRFELIGDPPNPNPNRVQLQSVGNQSLQRDMMPLKLAI